MRSRISSVTFGDEIPLLEKEGSEPIREEDPSERSSTLVIAVLSLFAVIASSWVLVYALPADRWSI